MKKENVMALFTFYDNGGGAYLSGSGSSYNSISQVVDKILILHKLSTAKLEAKVYTYEKIIANSNFAPMLKENEKESKGE